MEGSNDVGLDELTGAIDRPIDMAFGCQVQDCIRSVGLQGAGQTLAGGDIEPMEFVGLTRLKIHKRSGVACIGQGIDVANTVSLSDQVANEVRADKSGTPGNKELHRFIKSLIVQPANKLALLNSSPELEPQTTEEWIFSPPQPACKNAIWTNRPGDDRAGLRHHG